MTNVDMMEEPVEGIYHAEIVYANKAIKTGKAAAYSEVKNEIIDARGQVVKEVMRKLCDRALDRKCTPL